MSADRNLLFGILAVQMDFVTRDQLIAGMNAWVLEKSKPLGKILHQQGSLVDGRRTLLEALVNEHLAQHNNDPQQSLAAVSSIKSVRQDLEQLADSDVAASLVHVSQQSEVDPFATRAATAGDATSSGTRFRILRPHAKGGLGQVSVALDAELHREVAFKEIKPEYAHRNDSRGRFLVEAEVTGGLEHPGIVPVYGLGTYADGRPYYAMRFIEGDTLDKAIREFHKQRHRSADPLEHDVAFRKLLGRFVDICNAVGYAHSRGVLHRDLKPGNVMLGQHGETLVVDWGLAKVQGVDDPENTGSNPLNLQFGSGTDNTLPGSAIGTPGYMSPEQANGQLDQLGPTTDIYSLGCILYTLLTGEVPVRESQFGEFLRRVTHGDFPTPREKKATIPKPLEAICLKAMSTDHNKRFHSCGQLSEPIEEYLAGRELTSALERERSAREQAEEQTRLAEQRQSDLERQLYYNKIYRVRGDLESGRLLQARQVMSTIPLGQRGWESRYLCRKLHGDQLTVCGVADQVNAVAFSPDGSRLASAASAISLNDNAGAIEVWDLMTGKRLSIFQGHSAAITCIAFSPTGQEVLSGSADHLAILWDTLTTRQIAVFKGHSSLLSDVAFSSDGKRILTASHDKKVKVWDLSTRQELVNISGNASIVTCAAFSSDGQRVVSGSWDGLKVWDAKTGVELLDLDGHAGRVSDVTFSPDDTEILAGGRDKTVQVWNAVTGKISLNLIGHTTAVHSVDWCPDGQDIVSAGWDGTIKVWNTQTGDCLSTQAHGSPIHCVRFSPDGRRIASGGKGKTVAIRGKAPRHHTSALTNRRKPVDSLSISSDSRLVASGHRDGVIKIWDPVTENNLCVLHNSNGRVSSVDFDLSGERIVAASWDGNANIWDLETKSICFTLQGHTDSVLSVVYSNDNQKIISAGADHTVRVWDATTGEELNTLRGHSRAVNSVGCSRDSTSIVSGGIDGLIKIWDANTGEAVKDLNGHSNGVNAVAFDPTGRIVASAGRDKVITIWDVVTGREMTSLRGHSGIIHSVAFSPDGLRIVSGCSDKTIRIWDATTGFEIFSLHEHLRWVSSVLFSPDGRWIISASADGSVRFWDSYTITEEQTLAGQCNSPEKETSITDGRYTRCELEDGGQVCWNTSAGGFILNEVLPDDMHRHIGHYKVVNEAGEMRLIRTNPGYDPWAEDTARRAVWDPIYHEQDAADAEKREDWFAARFHLRWLVKHDPENMDFRDRLATADANYVPPLFPTVAE